MKDLLEQALADVLNPDPLSSSVEELVTKTAEQNDRRVSDYQRGYQAAMEELQPQIEKLAAAAVQRVTAEEQKRRNELDHFEGEVAVHSCLAALATFKTSMANGKCWDCGVRPVNPSSMMQRCAACDSMDS